jgi:acyl-CoA synthetase (AMP-forming)/AMP-acid ligase II
MLGDVMTGNIRRTMAQGESVFQVTVDEETGTDLTAFRSISDLLVWRAQRTPERPLYSVVDSKGKEIKTVTYKKMTTKIVDTTLYLLDKKGLRAQDKVLLCYPMGLDLIIAVHACFYCAIVPLVISPPEKAEDVAAFFQLMDAEEITHVLVNSVTESLLKDQRVKTYIKERSRENRPVRAHSLVNTSRLAKTKQEMTEGFSSVLSDPNFTAFVDLVVQSGNGKRLALHVTHAQMLARCRAIKDGNYMLCTDWLLCNPDAYAGHPFLVATLLPIYVGCGCFILNEMDGPQAMGMFIEAASKLRGKI